MSKRKSIGDVDVEEQVREEDKEENVKKLKMEEEDDFEQWRAQMERDEDKLYELCLTGSFEEARKVHDRIINDYHWFGEYIF